MMVLLSSIGSMTEMYEVIYWLYYLLHDYSVFVLLIWRSRSISLSICSALKKYAENANKKSRIRLADKKFLNTLLSMVYTNNNNNTFYICCISFPAKLKWLIKTFRLVKE